MRDINIVLEPFNFISIIDCKIYKSLNNHSTMTFTGRISSEEEKIIIYMFENLSFNDKLDIIRELFIRYDNETYFENKITSR